MVGLSPSLPTSLFKPPPLPPLSTSFSLFPPISLSVSLPLSFSLSLPLFASL